MRIKLNAKIKLNKMVRDEIEKIIKKRIKKNNNQNIEYQIGYKN
jgi:hypothetical protein